MANDGGPAFPAELVERENGVHTLVMSSGMSLRDYFAAAALTGALAHGVSFKGKNAIEKRQSLCNRAASIAYIAADAMLAAREARHD